MYFQEHLAAVMINRYQGHNSWLQVRVVQLLPLLRQHLARVVQSRRKRAIADLVLGQKIMMKVWIV